MKNLGTSSKFSSLSSPLNTLFILSSIPSVCVHVCVCMCVRACEKERKPSKYTIMQVIFHILLQRIFHTSNTILTVPVRYLTAAGTLNILGQLYKETNDLQHHVDQLYTFVISWNVFSFIRKFIQNMLMNTQVNERHLFNAELNYF